MRIGGSRNWVALRMDAEVSMAACSFSWLVRGAVLIEEGEGSPFFI